MTYSCTDFTDDVFAELHRVGAITQPEYDDDELVDNANLQAAYAMSGIARLVEVKDAFDQYRRAVEDLAAHKGLSLQDGVFCQANERAKTALAAVRVRAA